MTADTRPREPGVAAQYDRAAAIIPELTVLNYGFSSDSEPTVVPPESPEFYCLRLYEHALRGITLRGANVLEVSCGRGGGASFLMRTFGPASYVGIDLSEENIRLAAARADGPKFILGNAQELPFSAASFDVVLNIEASHLYADRKRFFAETYRTLRPGGHFCYADGCWANDDCRGDLLEAGFALLDREEITANVVRALEEDGPRREALFDSIPDPALREEYKNWGGVVGYRAYERLANRETPYFSYLLRRG